MCIRDRDKLVEWEGRPARMEIAVDVGDRMKERGSHTSKYHMETVMLETLRVLNTADCSCRFAGVICYDFIIVIAVDVCESSSLIIVHVDSLFAVVSNPELKC